MPEKKPRFETDGDDYVIRVSKHAARQGKRKDGSAGKSFTVGSSHGNVQTGEMVDGRPLNYTARVFYYPERD